MPVEEPYDSTEDTQEHIAHVRRLLEKVARKVIQRGSIHDFSKLLPPEKEAFDRCTPVLRDTTYGSPEYEAAKAQLGAALAHHYQANSHHPEHYPDGIAGMNLLDLVEMYCDWKAASLRHKDGDFRASLKINQERFGISDQLMSILENSVGLVE